MLIGRGGGLPKISVWQLKVPALQSAMQSIVRPSVSAGQCTTQSASQPSCYPTSLAREPTCLAGASMDKALGVQPSTGFVMTSNIQFGACRPGIGPDSSIGPDAAELSCVDISNRDVGNSQAETALSETKHTSIGVGYGCGLIVRFK